MHGTASRLAAGLIVSALAACAAGAAAPVADPAAAGEVRVGRTLVLVLRADDGFAGPAERARDARAAIDAALADPGCERDRIGVEIENGHPVVFACTHRVVVVSPADAAAEGVAADELAFRWAEKLRVGFATEKNLARSALLLRRAILGLILPFLFLGLVVLVRVAERRVRRRMIVAPPPSAGMRIAGLRVLASRPERRRVARLAWVAAWVAYLFLTYVFVIVLFRQFPGTARWTTYLVEPLLTASGEFGRWVPVVGLVVLALVALRVVLALLGRIFEQVRAGELRLEPVLSPDTAGPAELLARGIAVLATVGFIGLVVPGEAGTLFGGVLGIVALALALGAWETGANLVAGLVSVYGRPLRRGQRVRIGAVEGTLLARGLLHMRVERADGRVVLVPNRKLMTDPAETGAAARLRLRLVLRATGGPETALGLVRHATAAAGLRREDVRADLAEVREGRLVVDADWPAGGDDLAALRHRLIEALLDRAPGLDAEVVAVGAAPDRAR